MSTYGTYYRLLDDMRAPGRWFLGVPRTVSGAPIDAAAFLESKPVSADEPLLVGIRQPGIRLAFTLADFDMPVLERALADRVAARAAPDVQMLTARVDDHDGAYAVMNVLTVRDCLDEHTSSFDRWQPGEADDQLAGSYRTVYDLRIDSSRTGDAAVLRIAGWVAPLIVREDIAAIFAEYSGTVLVPC